MSDRWDLVRCSVQVAHVFMSGHRYVADWLGVGESYLDTSGLRDVQQTAVHVRKQVKGRWMGTVGEVRCQQMPGVSDDPHLLVPARVVDMSARGVPGSSTTEYLYCAKCQCLVKTRMFK